MAQVLMVCTEQQWLLTSAGTVVLLDDRRLLATCIEHNLLPSGFSSRRSANGVQAIMEEQTGGKHERTGHIAETMMTS